MDARRTQESDGDPDRFGLDERQSILATYAGKLVPQALARRAITVSVTTDATRYTVGDSVEISIEFRNRLPLPVTVELPTRRLWTWTVDGLPAASDERTRTPGGSGEFSFRPREQKTVERRWDGRFERVTDGPDGTTPWEPAAAGEHEIAVHLAVEGRQPADATTVVFEG